MMILNRINQAAKQLRQTVKYQSVDSLLGTYTMPTKSMQNVGPISALRLPVVYACIKILSETLAMIPIELVAKSGRSWVVQSNDKRHQLVNGQPNDTNTAVNWKMAVQGHISSWGNGLNLIQRDNTGMPIAIWPAHPSFNDPQRNILGELEYLLYFFLHQPLPSSATLPSEDVLHIPALSFDGVRGYSPIMLLRESIGTSLAAEEVGAEFFDRGARVMGVLKSETKIDKDHRKAIQDDFKRMADDKGMTPILDRGLSYERIGIDPQDAQFLPTQEFTVARVSGAYGIPAKRVNQIIKGEGVGNSEQDDLNFIKNTMTPIFQNWVSSLNSKLLFEEEKGQKTFRFNLMEYLKADTKTRGQLYKDLFNTGAMTPADIQQAEGMEVSTDPGMDTNYIPVNMQSSELAEKSVATVGNSEIINEEIEETEETSNSEDEERNLKIIGQISRLANKEKVALEKNSQKHSGEALQRWFDDFMSKHTSEIQKVLDIPQHKLTDYNKNIRARIRETKEFNDTWYEESFKALLKLTNEHK